MVQSILKEEGPVEITVDNLNKVHNLNKIDVDLAIRASRAFAVEYVNEIYRTIQSLDPDIVKKLKITKHYPYSLYIFIQQDKPKEIKHLDIYIEKKSTGDGSCEVKEIYHSSQLEDSSIEEKQKCVSDRCIGWSWNLMDITKMNILSLAEGKKVGKHIYDDYQISCAVSTLNSLLNKM